MEPQMKTIGLVGGVASGKSLAAKMLAELGAGVLDADRAGHAVLAEDAEVRAVLRERWGDAVFTGDGSVNRASVAQRVFGDGQLAEAERRFLESLVHPRIGERLAAQRDRLAADGKHVAVLDAALLFEAGWQSLCDIVLFVDAPRDVRLQRAKSRGWTDAEFTQREAAQWPVDEKRRAADFVLNNDGSEDDLRQAVQQFWDRHLA
jgi:dephospho-CoA kinase